MITYVRESRDIAAKQVLKRIVLYIIPVLFRGLENTAIIHSKYLRN